MMLRLIILFCCFIVCEIPVWAWGASHEFVVTDELLAQKPISPRLYGNFIELGYGMQVEPMWSEMLFNRSFEPFTPYKSISVEWFDLWNKPGDLTQGYKTDWRDEDWYHSGYEHNPWFAAPGVGGVLPIDEKSNFLVPVNSTGDVVLSTHSGGSGHGTQYLLVENRQSSSWGGLAQQGKLLRPATTYKFRGKFRGVNNVLGAEVRLYPIGKWEMPLVRVPLDDISSEWTEKTLELRNDDFAGWATLAVWLPPGAALEVDDFSLMPEKNFYGWRSDILAPLSEIRPGVMRFPGGCFASFYNWRDGIGPAAQRKPQPSYFWGGQNYNDVGTAELAMLSQKIGAEMMYCVNVHHPTKPDYEWYFGENGAPPGKHGYDFKIFRNIAEGAKSAADLVAYCNLPVGKHPLADLRASHGYSEPFSIKYWELDNEVHRWFEPEEYAHAAVAYSKAMKKVDPTIKLGLVTYGERLNQDGTPRLHYQDYVPQMLEIAGEHIDFLADRGPSEMSYLQRMIGYLRSFNASHDTSLVYCETEKLFYEQFPDVQNRIQSEGGFTKSYMFSKWYYAMKVLMEFMAYQRLGGEIDFVIFNNLANTHSQCVLETPKEGVFVTAAGIAMRELSHSPAAWPLKFDGYTAQYNDNFQVSAAWNQDKTALVIYVLNRTKDAQESTFQLGRMGRSFAAFDRTTLDASDPFAMNTLKNPDSISRKHSTGQSFSGKDCRVEVAPWSFTQIVLY